MEDTSRKQSKPEFEGFDNLEDCSGDVVSRPTISQNGWVLALLAHFSSEVEEFRYQALCMDDSSCYVCVV